MELIHEDDVALEEPTQPGGSFGGDANAAVEAVEVTDMEEGTGSITKLAEFPCHVELVPLDRVRRWCSESEDFDAWLSGNEPGKLHTVEIEGKPYVLFVTPFA